MGCERSWEFLSSDEGSFLPGTLGRPILCIFHPQNKLSPHQNPSFGPILYKFIVMGPVRKSRPHNWCRLWESCSCDDECNSLLRRGQIPQERGYGGQSTVPQEENCQVIHSSTCLWHHVRGPRPHQGLDPRESRGRPRWALIEEGGGRAKHFQGAPWWNQFWKIGICAF